MMPLSWSSVRTSPLTTFVLTGVKCRRFLHHDGQNSSGQRAWTLATAATFAASALAAQQGQMNLPDFTKSAKILASAIDDWNLGATGLRGRMFCDQMIITDARQIAITKVNEGSPAFGLLQVGDMILGVGGKLFSYDPRTEFGKALTAGCLDRGRGQS